MSRPRALFLIISLALLFVWSAVRPHDYFTWFLEVAPALAGSFIIAFTRRRFPLSSLLYHLLWMHAIVLIVGGHYTYALNPLFDWFRETFGLQRNYYDRLGHFFQGFVPALLTRELLIRRSTLVRGGWMNFLTVCVCLAVSAFYELIEWWVAETTGEAAEAFLGTQGDVWDTQWDMFMALIGAVCAVAFFSRLHDRSLSRLERDGKG